MGKAFVQHQTAPSSPGSTTAPHPNQTCRAFPRRRFCAVTPLRLAGDSTVSPRVGNSGWPPQHNPLLASPGWPAPRGAGRVFWEGEGYDFVLFIANHGSPPNAGKAARATGRLLLHGAAFPRPGKRYRPHLSQDKQHLMHASTEVWDAVGLGAHRSSLLRPALLINKAKIKQIPGEFCSQQRPARYF